MRAELILLFPALVVVGAAATLLLLRDDRVRLAVLVFGGLLVFQSSSELSLSKYAYLAVIILALTATLRDPPTALTRRSWVVGALLVALCGAAVVRGNQLVWVLRDASYAFLLVTAAPLAVHFGRRLPEQTIFRLMNLAAALGVYAFVAQWIVNRGLGSLPTPGVPSVVLFSMAIAAASAMATLDGKRAGRWWVVVAVIFAAGLLTGTRNMLLMALAPLTIMGWSAIRMRTGRSSARWAILKAVPLLPFVVAGTFFLASTSSIDVGQALERLTSVLQVTSGAEGARQSLDLRLMQQDLAWAAFQEDPVLGRGPGTVWEWRQPWDRELVSSTSMDTSVVIAAKWGLIGTLALVALVWAWWRVLRPRRDAPSVWTLTALGMAPVLLAQSVLAAVLEDRGLPLALMLLGAGLVASSTTDRPDVQRRGRPVATMV